MQIGHVTFALSEAQDRRLIVSGLNVAFSWTIDFPVMGKTICFCRFIAIFSEVKTGTPSSAIILFDIHSDLENSTDPLRPLMFYPSRRGYCE